MNHEKIEVLFEHNAVGLFGDNGVEGVNLVKRWGEPDEERYSLPIDGFFLAIGHQPNTEIFKEYIDTDEVGYIITDGDSPRTKVPGVFAAGDVADPHYRQCTSSRPLNRLRNKLNLSGAGLTAVTRPWALASSSNARATRDHSSPVA